MSAKRSSSRLAQGDAFDQLAGKCRQMPKVGVDELQGVARAKGQAAAAAAKAQAAENGPEKGRTRPNATKVGKGKGRPQPGARGAKPSENSGDSLKKASSGHRAHCRQALTCAVTWVQWGRALMARIRPRMIHRLKIDESSMDEAMSAYWFMHDAAAVPSLGAKPRTLP